MHSQRRQGSSDNSGPTYMSRGQMGDYLHHLRSNRLSRPTTCPEPETCRSSSPTSSSAFPPTNSSGSFYYQRPSHKANSSTDSSTVPLSFESYHRRGLPHEESPDTQDISETMDHLSLDSDRRLHQAAQRQAAELIQRHKNDCVSTTSHPQSTHPEHYHNKHLSLSRLRTQKSDLGPRDPSPTGSEPISADLPNIKKRSSYSKLANYWNNSGLNHRRRSSGSKRSLSGKNKGVFTNPEDKIYEDPTDRVTPVPSMTVGTHHNQNTVPQPYPPRKNPFARGYSIQETLPHKPSVPQQPTTLNSHPKNSPRELEESSLCDGAEAIRFKDGLEVRSDDIRAATSARLKNRSQKLPSPSAVSNSPSRPIVSFKPDWTPQEEQEKRLALLRTSPAPPTSNAQTQSHNTVDISVTPPPLPVKKPSRQDTSKPVVPSLRFDAPSAPQQDLPTIMVDQPERSTMRESPVVPEIMVESPHSAKSDSKRLRDGRQSQSHRNSAFPPPQPQPSFPPIDPYQSKPHITPVLRRETALCAQCALPIAGRIVSAAGLRFHPHCFTCCHCGEGLECVDFYPEPAKKRDARLDRIQSRMEGNYVEEVPGATEVEDGDDSLRFYCHLDFHELFSPRCKSCKTPIEGEVVVACGAEWHVGHFFCAQCGDPFDQTTPYVEREGYAWCLECHTNRYAAKCKKCRLPVTNMVVQALGAEWHDECFCCAECGNSFEDGKFFLRSGSQDPVCPACEQRRLKA